MQFNLRTILTIPTKFSLAKVLLMIFGMILPTQANPQELTRCGRALSLAVNGTMEGNLRQDICPISSRLVQWLQFQNPSQRSNQSFSSITAFLRNNPEWPRDRLQKLAEENLNDGEKTQTILKWFDDNPPQTAKGATFYALALLKAKRINAAKKVIQNAWVNFDLEGPALKPFWTEFKAYLTKEDHQRRVDRLLMGEKVAAAKFMFPWLNDDHKALAEARIALIQQAGDVDTKLKNVPATLANDPGLTYDRIKWHRRKENNVHMLALFEESTHPEEDAELWWKERNLLIRRLMDEGKYQDAYNLAKAHGLSSGENYANGEWLAGWLALRMLNRPGIAFAHFQALSENVKSPISYSRAAYWASRAATRSGKKEEAQRWMIKAKAHHGTYYGQIALRGGLAGPTPPLHSKRPAIDVNVRKKFESREMVQVIRLLCAVGAKHLIEPFGIKLAQEMTDPGEQILMIELAANECGPYFGVVAAKKLPLKHVPLIEAAYPILPRHFQKQVHKTNAALVHAIIRQESRFKPDALSPAGAQGLMQLMPKTAAQTAKNTNVRLGSLSDPKVNVPLGCAHLAELLSRYNGSLILSIAAYNAGVTAVDSWIQKYGDPRKPGVDLIDWVETIPYAETRNYVQRVLENHAYYHQRLGK
jgi:soluble lytic murein transglycosylase